MNIKNTRLVDFSVINDDRGFLISLEQNKNIPFEVKRVYYIFNTKPGVRRGFHAHKELDQVLVCVKGSCTVLIDDAVNKKNVILSKANKGLYVGPMVWHEMYDFSEDCVLLVVASEIYDKNDYIGNYKQFKCEVERKRL